MKKYKYEKIADELRERISGGRWADQATFPTELQLAREYGVCHLTIRKALEVLISEGLVVRQRGRGTFINEANATQESGCRLLYVGKTESDFYKELYVSLGRAGARLNVRIESICGTEDASGHMSLGMTDAALREILQSVQTVVCGHEMVEVLLPPARDYGVRILVVDLYHRDYENFPGHVITADLFRATCLASDHLVAQGHRHIGFVGSPDTPVTGKPYHRPALSRLSLQGYRASLEMAGLKTNRALEVGPDGITVEACVPILVSWLQGLKQWPTAFVCDGDFRAAALIRAAAHFGKSCPKDFSVISTGNTSWCGMSTPSLSSVYMGEREMAELAVVLAVHAGFAHPVDFQVSPRLVLRESVSACKP